MLAKEKRNVLESLFAWFDFVYEMCKVENGLSMRTKEATDRSNHKLSYTYTIGKREHVASPQTEINRINKLDRNTYCATYSIKNTIQYNNVSHILVVLLFLVFVFAVLDIRSLWQS